MKQKRNSIRITKQGFIVLVAVLSFSLSISLASSQSTSEQTTNISAYNTASTNQSLGYYSCRTLNVGLLAVSSATTTRAKSIRNISHDIIEEDLQLEDWMLDSNHNFWNNMLLSDREDEIALEDWMLDSSNW